jgi:acyl carrier protein
MNRRALSIGLLVIMLFAFADAGRTAEDSSECTSRVRQIIVEHFDVPPGKVTLGARLAKDLKADALDIVELTLAIEHEFKIVIPDNAAVKFVTVEDVIVYLRQRVQGRRNGPRCR